MDKAIILLSGGLDSATVGALAKQEQQQLYAMSFRYGQRHSFELLAADKIAAWLRVDQHRIIDIDLKSFGDSSLTSSGAVPKGGVDTSVIPTTYVPARNTIFLAFALGWAEVLGAQRIYIGVNAVDYSGYPDCRPVFVEAFQNLSNVATKMGVTQGKGPLIVAPLQHKSKSEIITLASTLEVPLHLTHSCYDPDDTGRACGLCDSCRLRKQGFEEAKVPDPTTYYS